MQYCQVIEEYKSDIISRFEPARLMENILTPAQVDQLMLYQFQKSTGVRWSKSSNNMQPVCNTEKIFSDLPWLQTLFESELGMFSEFHSGNFFITTQLHDVHVDLLTADEVKQHSDWENLIPYKSCVIPLAIGDRSTAYTAFFDQRHIGYSITLDRDYQTQQKNSLYHISRQYPNFYLIDGSECNSEEIFTSGDHDVVFPHINRRNLDGLTVETVFEFKPGNIMVFDACQIHASCLRTNQQQFSGLKNGINIQFYLDAQI